jgi:hypothetical protein
MGGYLADDADGDFRTSSFSGGGNCVQARQLGNGDIVVRDSRNPLNSIVVTSADWVAFVQGVKNSEFDFSRSW